MNIQELESELILLGVNPGNYTLYGYTYKDSSWVIEQHADKKKSEKWSVFNFERGKKYDLRFFDSEDEACRYLLEKLKNSSTS